MFQPGLLARTLTALALGSLALTSCSGGGNAVPSASSGAAPSGMQPPSSSSSVLRSLESDAVPPAAVYVSDSTGKSVFRFVRNPDGTLVTPAGSSLVLTYNPGPIAIGHSGNLFVTDEENESIEVYAKGATGSAQPIRSLLLPFVPSCVAVDRTGHEYVGGFTNGYVAVFAPGAQGPANTLQRIALPDRHIDINGVAVDRSGNLFVSDTNEVSEFAMPVTNPTLERAIIGSGEQNSPTGLAANSKTGELYVANTGDNNILAYSPTANGKSHPDRTISSQSPSLVGPLGVANYGTSLYSTSGTVFNGPASIFVFDALKGSQAPKQVVTGSYLALPVGVALGP